ncbi:unnamed protein product [Amoebophrya sp. A25]|nr:unnamed protein product [Amoebophrya sp. A25]|eukprot:GSA25T00020656001.1
MMRSSTATSSSSCTSKEVLPAVEQKQPSSSSSSSSTASTLPLGDNSTIAMFSALTRRRLLKKDVEHLGPVADYLAAIADTGTSTSSTNSISTTSNSPSDSSSSAKDRAVGVTLVDSKKGGEQDLATTASSNASRQLLHRTPLLLTAMVQHLRSKSVKTNKKGRIAGTLPVVCEDPGTQEQLLYCQNFGYNLGTVAKLYQQKAEDHEGQLQEKQATEQQHGEQRQGEQVGADPLCQQDGGPSSRCGVPGASTISSTSSTKGTLSGTFSIARGHQIYCTERASWFGACLLAGLYETELQSAAKVAKFQKHMVDHSCTPTPPTKKIRKVDKNVDHDPTSSLSSSSHPSSTLESVIAVQCCRALEEIPMWVSASEWNLRGVDAIFAKCP